MPNPFPYHYICIEGNIGAGKSSFCKRIEQEYNCDLILEQFDDNPFLPYFYKDPSRYAFPVELFFMTERHKQLQQHLLKPDLFTEFILSDYFFRKTSLFAKNNLHDDEFRLFQRLYSILETSFPKPDILVYLHRSVNRLLLNIINRGRKYEKNISREYLESVQDAYFDYFKNEASFPIVIIDVENMDFEHKKSDYDLLISLLSKEYLPGVHRISISS